MQNKFSPLLFVSRDEVRVSSNDRNVFVEICDEKRLYHDFRLTIIKA